MDDKNRIYCDTTAASNTDSVFLRKLFVKGGTFLEESLMCGTTRTSLHKQCKHIKAATEEACKDGKNIRNRLLTPKERAERFQRELCVSGDELYSKFCPHNVD